MSHIGEWGRGFSGRLEGSHGQISTSTKHPTAPMESNGSRSVLGSFENLASGVSHWGGAALKLF